MSVTMAWASPTGRTRTSTVEWRVLRTRAAIVVTPGRGRFSYPPLTGRIVAVAVYRKVGPYARVTRARARLVETNPVAAPPARRMGFNRRREGAGC